MSKLRDPRIDPKPGDQIKQAGTSYILRVTEVRDGNVSWQRKVRHGWVDDNTWTMKAWQNIVAKGAEIIQTGASHDPR